MSSEGVIKLKGDNSQLDSATEKSKKNFQALGEHASRSVGHARSFGDHWKTANTHLVRSLAHGLSIAAVLERMVELMTEFQNKSMEAAKSVGDIAISRDRAAAKMGLSNETARDLIGGKSSVDIKDRASFFSGLSEKTFGRGKQTLTQSQIAMAQQAYNSGQYSESEIDKALESGNLEPLGHARERLDSMSEEGRAAIATREYVNQQKQEAEDARAPSGNYYAAAEANFDADTARHPFGAKALLSSIPLGVGAAGKAIYNETIALGDKNYAPIKEALDAQTQIMRTEARRPTVGKPAE